MIRQLTPNITGYLKMTPNNIKIKNIKFFKNNEIFFKCELTDEFGFRRRL